MRGEKLRGAAGAPAAERGDAALPVRLESAAGGGGGPVLAERRGNPAGFAGCVPGDTAAGRDGSAHALQQRNALGLGQPLVHQRTEQGRFGCDQQQNRSTGSLGRVAAPDNWPSSHGIACQRAELATLSCVSGRHGELQECAAGSGAKHLCSGGWRAGCQRGFWPQHTAKLRVPPWARGRGGRRAALRAAERTAASRPGAGAPPASSASAPAGSGIMPCRARLTLYELQQPSHGWLHWPLVRQTKPQ